MGVTFSVAALEKQLSSIRVPIVSSSRSSNGKAATTSPREIFQNYKGVIPRGVMYKLAAKTATGDRSKVLWRIVNDLLGVGLTPGEVVVLVEATVWNKFGADRSRLWADVNKAHGLLSRNGNSVRKPRRPIKMWADPLHHYLAVDSRDPQWMIQDLWADKSHGIVAGEPKTRKSYIAIDIALSVATGSDCLAHFPIKQSRPVLMIQEEISDAEMRKRLRYIAESKDLSGEIHTSERGLSVHFPDPIPLYLRNRKQFDLSSGEGLETLNRQILDLEIGLVILDPLQMMLGGIDENRASEVRPVLQNLLKLKEATGSGIMIVHHYSKASSQNPRVGGQRMLGSQAFHGWVESALYLTKPEPYVTRVERELRNFEPLPDFDIEFGGGNESYYVSVSIDAPAKKPEKRTTLDEYIRKHPGVSLAALADHLKMSKKTLYGHVRRSPHLDFRNEQKKTGRPITIIVPK